MKLQAIPRLGQIVYPEKRRIKEQTLVDMIRLCVISFCIAFWYGVYRLFKAIFQ